MTTGIMALESADLNEIPVDLDDIDPDQALALEEEVAERQDDLQMASEAIHEGMKHLLVLEGIYQDHKAGRITPAQVKYVNFALEAASNSNYYDGLPVTRSVMVTEHIGNRIMEAIGSVFSAIHTAIKKQADYTQYSWTLFNMQRSRIEKIRRRIQGVSGSASADIRVGMNKYLMYGDAKHEVSNMQEYMKHFNEAMVALSPFLEAAADLTEDDLFSSLQFYKEYIFGEPEDFFRDRFSSIEKHVTAAMAGMKDKQTHSTPQYQEFSSGTLLGLSRLVVRTPKKNTYNMRDYNTILAAHRYFYMYVDRKTKINFGTMFSGRVMLTVHKKEIEEIISRTEQLIAQANKLLKFSVQLSAAGAVLDSNPFAHREANEEHDFAGVIRGMRIYTRICSIIYDSVSSGYNFGMGNVKQGLTIAEAAAKKL